MKKKPARVLFVVATFAMLVQFTSTVRAGLMFDEPVKFPSPINRSSSYEGSPVLSPNILELFFTSSRSGFGTYVAKRDTPSAPFGVPVRIVRDFNHPVISSDGLSLYANSDLGFGSADIWTMTRPSLDAPWDITTLQNLGENINSTKWERYAGISPDDKELYFTRTTGADIINPEIWVAKRTDRNAPFEPAVKLPANINQGGAATSKLSPDGLALFFADDRDGGYGNSDLWVSYRTDKDSPWGDPVNMGPTINSPDYEFDPSMAPDGRTILFARSTPQNSNANLWYAAVIPEPGTIILALLPIIFFGGWRRRLTR